MAEMRSKLVAGNWKMHGSLTENEALLGALVSGLVSASGADGAVCVPSPYLAQVQAFEFKNISVTAAY